MQSLGDRFGQRQGITCSIRTVISLVAQRVVDVGRREPRPACEVAAELRLPHITVTVALVASFSKEVVERGLSAAEVIRDAAQVVGGGGGGRKNVAQAGGRDASRLDEALSKARTAIEAKLKA